MLPAMVGDVVGRNIDPAASAKMVDRPAVSGQASEDPAQPFVTVVIPTRDRRDLLEKGLLALSRQNYPTHRFEVIVVDNHSSDGTQEMVERVTRDTGLNLMCEQGPNRGPAPSRNVGARMAKGEILAFTDSDCAPAPGWLRAGVETLVRNPDVGVVSGPVRLPCDWSDVPFFSHYLSIEAETFRFETANVFYRKSDFWAAGGFPELYSSELLGTIQGGDDVEMGWMIRRRGYGSAFVREASVVHAVQPINWRRWFAQPLAFFPLGLILRRCPELRSTLRWRMFLTLAAADRFKLLLAGVALSFLHPVALLLALPFLSYFVNPYPDDVKHPSRWPALLLKVAAWTIFNVILTVVLLASTIRYRRVIL